MVFFLYQNEVFGGEVVVFINNNIGSICEVLVYYLKKIKKGIIVGEKMVGVMLIGSFFKVNEYLRFFIFVVDYIIVEG